MSVAKKQEDERLVQTMLTEAVKWFHEAFAHPDNADRDLYELARECANGAFKNHCVAIPIPRRETVARKFMQACASTFAYEVPKAAAEKQVEIIQ